MIRAVLLLLSAFISPAFLPSAFASVAQPAETWYFARTMDTNELTAFTVAGAVHPLHVMGEPQFGLRIDAQTALFTLADENDAAHLYHVSPDQAVEIALPDNAEDFRQALAFSNGYAVLRQSTSVLPAPALLINLSTDQAELLTGNVLALARISADGQYLRYMSVSDQRWSLIERTLAMGTERSVYSATTDDPLPAISADTHGDRWLVPSREGVDTLISIEGTVTTLDTRTDGLSNRRTFFNDLLIDSAPTCGAACVLRVGDPASEITMALPADDSYQPLAEPQPGTLVVRDSGSALWLLDANAAPLKLGQYDALRMFMTVPLLISPDGRYVISASGNSQFTLWDLVTRAPLLTINGQYLDHVNYTSRGVIVHSDDNATESAVFYRYADGQSVALPHSHDGIYFDVLADNSLLYLLLDNLAGVGARGIYRYDPATQSYSALLANAMLIATPRVG